MPGSGVGGLCTDRGAVSVAFVSLALAVALAFGLVVDGSGRLTAYQRAHTIAGEAARSAGQAVDAGAVLSGAGTRVDPVAARRAAEQYLGAAGVAGTVTIGGDGTSIAVTATVTHRPVLLAGAATGVSATVEARLVRGITTEIP